MVPSCAICQRESKSWGSLAKHTSQTHKISAEKYFLKYLGTNEICKYCGSNDTPFLSMSEGFRKYCDGCGKTHQSKTAKERREKLKENPIAQAQFIDRLSKSVSAVWADRPTEEKERILKKFRNDKKPNFKTDPASAESDFERVSKATAKHFKLKIDYTKLVAHQLQAIVNQNLSEEFGF